MSYVETEMNSMVFGTEVVSSEERMQNYGFAFIPGGQVRMGTDRPLPCGVEGHRKNETPVRVEKVDPFWMSRIKVTNKEFERFMPKHNRSPLSPSDEHPVVDVMYGEVIHYAKWLAEQEGLLVRLPTEKEWVLAASPNNTEYPHGDHPNVFAGHVHNDGHEHMAVPVGDPRWKPNERGLDQMGYNVSEFVLGIYDAPGHGGALTDGCYCIAKGGNWGHCKRTPRVATRGIVDIATRSTRLGFRLACDA